MPLFRTDVILTSKRSSYLFRGTREPHFHSEHNFHLVYLRWICWLLPVGAIDLLLLYRFNIPFRMHCWRLFFSHIYFCLTVKLWGFAHSFFVCLWPANNTHWIRVRGSFSLNCTTHHPSIYWWKVRRCLFFFACSALKWFPCETESQRLAKCLIWQCTLDKISQWNGIVPKSGN